VIGELCTVQPLTNTERLARYILKRGPVPPYRIFKNHATRQGNNVLTLPRLSEGSRVLLRIKR